MPYDITWEPDGVYRRLYGTVTPDDLVHGQQVLHADSRFYRGRYAILDAREVTAHGVSEFEVIELAARAQGAFTTNPRQKLALVATDPGIIALGAIFASQPGTRRQVQVFATLEEARRWIDEDTGTP